ncbi:PepSY-associated TM helix domain-containing protein [Thermaerobacillus caldiproteolyticus]|uniref:Putative iron-regulated membrane protein n=1 Tax=Thermaerobacillus caldiproteolyticus TaxID=247480 RepID=A0A7V9Z7X6_9BACL|nr:PepSY domain-containing protein [Anoxybacillus caldiproteolyticus]MBA2875690.1 putative iron-regulated membrane protein [Anoxybacillus caldiproteolyticus]
MENVVRHYVPNGEQERKKKTGLSFYQTIWRWHFYAGIIFAPFLIILAFSGAVYLFKPQIESILYKNLYYVQETKEKPLPLSKMAANVQKKYPKAAMISVTLEKDRNRTVQVGMIENGNMFTVYVNPYTGKIVGKLNASEDIMEIFKKIHSELLIGGTVANRIVELAACWALILLLTGLYIWWPRNKSSIWGTFFPRLRKKGRPFWRDMHAVLGFWLTGGILLLILTGLPWTGVMGEGINWLATSTKTGYPPFSFSFGPKPESVTVTKEVAQDVPWAAENLPVPASKINGYVPLSIDDVDKIAEKEHIIKPFTISMPQGPTGVFTIATSKTSPKDNATLHVDQYTGQVLSDVRFSDYGIMAKAITIGIALHEGRLFGLVNQMINLIACLGLILIAVSSFVMWRKRKPQGKLGAPAKAQDKKVMRAVTVMMFVMGCIMPLVGISIIAVLLLDKLVIPRIKPLNEWLTM